MQGEKGREGLSRRRFIGSLAALGLGGAAASTGLFSWQHLKEARAEGARPAVPAETAERQWGMVIDLRRCDGCGKCTKACQAMHHLNEDEEWIHVYEMKTAGGQEFYMPRLCMMCQDAPCLKVCPVGATFMAEDGVVLVDQDACIGCRMCMAACPYEARTFNWSEPDQSPGLGGPPRPEYPVPQQKGTVGKCVLCVHNLRYGKLPACVEACSMEALYVADFNADLATNGVETVKLSQMLKENDAFRYKEELGTEPRVYYIAGHGQDLDW